MAPDPHRRAARRDATEPLGTRSGIDPFESTRIARIETYDDAPDECTIHPADAPADVLTTTWITARGAAFVRLDAMR